MRRCARPAPRAAAAVVCAFLALPSCGKRGDPLPPLARTPQPPRDFALAQRGSELEVTFTAPRATTGGGRLGVLEMEILRTTRDGDFDKIALVDARQAVPGEVLVLREPLPPPGTPLRLAVRARSGRSVSSRSTMLALTVAPPPPPPTGLAAQLVPAGVTLVWTGEIPLAPSPSPPPSASPSPAATSTAPGASPIAPAAAAAPQGAVSAAPAPVPGDGSGPAASPSASPPPARARGAGFAVYRRAPDAEYAAPLAAGLEARTYLDAAVAPGQRWCYVVRTRAGETPLVESAPGTEVCVDVKDVVPPAPPTGLAAVPRAEAVEVSWSPSGETDLAGYRIYRTGPSGTPERLAELESAATRFTDTAPGRGAPHHYTVTAVDHSGNESGPSNAAEAHLP